VKGLRERFRCVVPDHLGFGLSDKPAGDAYRPRDQARRRGPESAARVGWFLDGNGSRRTA